MKGGEGFQVGFVRFFGFQAFSVFFGVGVVSIPALKAGFIVNICSEEGR